MSLDIELLPAYVESYYRDIVRKSSLNGVSFAYYKSLRGYFKHSILLTDIKQHEFGIVDYKMWERILTNIRSGRNPVESGGLYLTFADYDDICSRRSYYNTRRKFLDLELLLQTPFKDYYILNPTFIIKLYNPTLKKEEE
jgi:hypothetical protein